MNTFTLGQFVAGALLATSVAAAQEAPEQASDALGRLPLAFIENRGQFASPSRFVVRHHGQIARFEKDAIVLQLTRSDGGEVKGTLLRLGFEGASSQATVEGVAQQRCRYNYFLGDDPAQWRADVPSYSEVVYRELQPGVDVRVRDNAGCLEYDLVLAPGADLSKVVIHCEGARSIELGADGVLTMESEFGTIRQTLPLTWLEDESGARQPVECRYRKIDGERFGFEVAARDASRKLVIDPHLDWSTYFGGSLDEFARCVFVDSNGFVNLSGETKSADFPTTRGAYSRSLKGVQDAFFARLDPTATGSSQLVWCTYLGGFGDEYGAAFVVDGAGVITSGGQTNSPHFPTTVGALQPTLAGDYDAFLVRLDPSQSGTAQLVWSTYFGGASFDFAKIPHGGVDANGVVTVTGNTASKDFWTTSGAYSTTFSGVSDAFVARLDPAQTGPNQLLYSTFLGGSGDEANSSGEVDAAGLVYVSGWTNSSDYPTTAGAYSTSLSGDYDGWMARLSLDALGALDLQYSTYFGGTAYDDLNSLCIDDQGSVYCTGTTASKNLPTTPGAFDTSFSGPNGLYDAFVAHFDLSLTGTAQLVYSTYLGGAAGSDEGHVVVLGRSGELTVTGSTLSSNFPVTSGGFQTTYNGGGDGFVVRLRPAGNGAADMTYGTFLGGSGDDAPFHNRAADLDANDFPVVIGITNSTDFPTTTGAFSTALAGGYDAFLTRLAIASWFNYGSGLAGTNGVPAFTSQLNPVIGGSLTLDLGNSLGASTPALLLVGLADANVSAAGGTLLVNAFLFLPISVPAAGLPMSGSIPNDPLLTGVSVYLQALEADPAAVHGIAFTPGLRLILGY